MKRDYTVLESPVPQERVTHLWKKARQFGRSIGRLRKVAKDVELLGASKNVYMLKQRTFGGGDTGVTINPRCLLTSKDSFTKVWSVVMILILVYTVIVTPYAVAFIPEESVGLQIVGYAVDALFLTDIVVTFCSTYRNAEGVLVTNRKEIAKQYLKTWFAFDLIACFPFQLLQFCLLYTSDAADE